MFPLPKGTFCEVGCRGCIQCTTLCFQSCILIFCNEHAQSTTLGLKLMFRVVSPDSVAERYPVQSRVPGVHAMHLFVLPKLRLVFSQRTCPIHSFKPKSHVPGGFRAILLPKGTHYEVGCRGCIQCTTLCFQICVLFFCNVHAQSTPLGLKLMFRVVSRD